MNEKDPIGTVGLFSSTDAIITLSISFAKGQNEKTKPRRDAKRTVNAKKMLKIARMKNNYLIINVI
jgi:hypothetical protein